MTQAKLPSVLLWAALGVLFALTGLGFLGEHWLWFDILADFRLHFVIGGAVLAASAAAIRSRRALFVALLVVPVNGGEIVPLLVSDEVPAETKPMKIIGYNLYWGNSEISSAVDFVRAENADVVVLLEVLPRWWSDLDQLQDIYPYRYYGPAQHNPAGASRDVAILSKKKWLSAGAALARGTAWHSASWVRFPSTPDGSGFTLVGVHLPAPVTRRRAWHQVEADALADFVAAQKGPVVVVGDFNMTPYSYRFRSLLQKSGLTRAEGGMMATWPSILTPMGLPLDHVLSSGDFASVRQRAGPRLDSDHLPIIATVVR